MVGQTNSYVIETRFGKKRPFVHDEFAYEKESEIWKEKIRGEMRRSIGISQSLSRRRVSDLLVHQLPGISSLRE